MYNKACALIAIEFFTLYSSLFTFRLRTGEIGRAHV